MLMRHDPQTDEQTDAPGDDASDAERYRGLAEAVRERLARDGIDAESAADAIGVPAFRLQSLLGGGSVNASTGQRIEAWLAGRGPTAPDGTPAAEQPATTEPAPAPKRRGRPPKAKPAATPETVSAEPTSSAPVIEAPSPKRRGRPPKAASAAGAEPTAPKRRGRPPKNPDAVASPPKRRGRPPKNPNAAVTPKRRGRPPKSPSAAAAPAAPKRRGRPPKNPAATAPVLPPRRGRPPKNQLRLGDALRELFRLGDDELALAVHRAAEETRKRVEAALRGS
jgi:hypothetical protein